VLPLYHEEHRHQAGMTQLALEQVRTPMILFVEHDTPIVTTREINWPGLCDVVMNGHADMVRLHYNYRIDDDHWPLMLDREPKLYDGVPLIRTYQWSQRPHLASTSFYRRILTDKFSPSATTMIEDHMYGIVQDNYLRNRDTGWNNYRLAIYVPEGGNMQRSYHTNGRGNDSKFEDEFKY
jgi:hypothetical protein